MLSIRCHPLLDESEREARGVERDIGEDSIEQVAGEGRVVLGGGVRHQALKAWRESRDRGQSVGRPELVDKGDRRPGARIGDRAKRGRLV